MAQGEQEIHRRYAIDHRFYDWGTELPSDAERATADLGRIPMVSICTCVFRDGATLPWSTVASGQQDAYLNAMAQRFRDWGKPAFFVFDAEAEDHLATRGTAEEYRAAWRHLVGIFRAAGATNVAFVWATTAYAFDPSSNELDRARALYPGDDVVDWIGVDPYNFDKDGIWLTLADLLDPWYRWVTAEHPGKPLVLTEWGSKEDPDAPLRKASWLRAAPDVLQRRYPKVKAAVYFDEEKHERGTVNDWRIDTSPASLAAFREVAQSRFFAAAP